MKIKRLFAALMAALCVLCGLFTLTKYGVHVTKMTQAAQSLQDSESNRGMEEFPRGWHLARLDTSHAVEGSIVAQLKAFRSDDYKQASYYQSKVFKLNHISLIQFRQMIQSEYPEFASYKSVLFGPIMTSPDSMAAQAPVKLMGTDGRSVFAVYIMVLEDGAYRVSGVEGGMGERRTPTVKATIS